MDLCHAVTEMKKGLIDADLGGGVLKKRVRLAGRGKSPGYRTIVVTNKNDRWFFVHGFKKSEKDNIGTKELKALKKLSSDLLPLDVNQIAQAVTNGMMTEICGDTSAKERKHDEH